MKWTRLFVLALMPALGCGSGSLPEPADLDAARTALRDALDSWQRGEPAEALHGRAPPLYHNDKDRTAGKRLAAYKLDGTGGMHGRQVRWGAVLSFKDGDGAAEKKVRYLIDTHPALVITREDL